MSFPDCFSFYSFTYPLYALVWTTGGKGKNVVRPYDPNESNGSWSVVLVVIVPVAQMFFMVVICVAVHHLYTTYCQRLFCCCRCCCCCCRRKANACAERQTKKSVKRIKRPSDDADSSDNCAVPMTTLGATLWHSNVESIFANGTAGGSVPYSNGHRQSGHSLPALQENAFLKTPKCNSNNHELAVSESGNASVYKSAPTYPQTIYRPNEVSCVVECHALPPPPPPPSEAYEGSHNNSVNISSSSRQHYHQPPERSVALTLPSTSSTNYYTPDCDVTNAMSDELDEIDQQVSLHGDLEEEAELPEIQELFFPLKPPCIIHNPPRPVSASSKSPLQNSAIRSLNSH